MSGKHLAVAALIAFATVAVVARVPMLRSLAGI